MATNKFSPDYHFKYGPEENLSKLDYESGSIIFTVEGKQYIDINGSRLRVSDIKNEYTEEELTATSLSFQPHGLPTIYIANDTCDVYFYNTKSKRIQPLTVILAEAATNDSAGNNIANTYYKKVDADTINTSVNEKITDLYSRVAALPKWIIRVINGGESLPVKGDEGVVYFLQIGGNSDTVYETYIWIDDGNYYVKTGSTSADLDNYVSKKELSSSLDSNTKTITAAYTKADTALSERIDSLSTSVDDLGVTVENVKGSINDEITPNIKANTSNISSLSSDLSSVKSRLETLESGQGSQGGEITNVTAAINSINNNINTINENVKDLQEDTGNIKDDVSTNKSNISSLTSTVESVSNQTNTNTNSIANLIDDVSDVTSKMSTVSKDIDSTKTDIADLKSNKVDKSGDTMTGSLVMKEGSSTDGCSIQYNSETKCISFIFS